MKLGIIFGGASSERFVSVVSATSIITNLDNKYKVFPIYLDESNNWYQVNDVIDTIYELGKIPKHLKKITNPIKHLKKLDVIFPCIHGKYGEDGKIQGLLELANIPYVGCGVFSSALAYDKVYTKKLLSLAGINTTPGIVLEKKDNKYLLVNDDFSEKNIDIKVINQEVIKRFDFPVFVKPAREGSSVGVLKVNTEDELDRAINEAFKYDNKILLEKSINARELECSILNGNPIEVGEVKSAENFYSYTSKYTNKESFTIIPAEINEDLKNRIMAISKKAFRVISGKSIARIDFFYDEDKDELYLNEINTMPGFTTISMYPKLAVAKGVTYLELLDLLITDACKNFTKM